MKVKNETDRTDEEPLIKTTGNRKSTVFLALRNICENISYHTIRVVLSIYLTDTLLYSKSNAKIVFHLFNFMVCLFLILGSVSPFGKFRTMLWMSLLSITGSALLSLATVPAIAMDTQVFSLIALFLIAARLGGDRPWFIKLEGNFYKQDKWSQRFFLGYGLLMIVGILYTGIKVPLIKETSCLGQNNCFTAVFAIPASLMVISVVAIIVGKSVYTSTEENVAVKVVKCMMYALKVKGNSKETKEHWLDYAEDEYEKGFINSVKGLLKVSFLALPLPIFWALFEQQGSSWTFQARMMTVEIDDILPDHMQTANIILGLIAIQVLVYAIYPLFGKLRIKTPLQLIVVSGLLTAASFFIAAKISIILEGHVPIQPTNGIGHIRIYNTMPCSLDFQTNAPFRRLVLPPLGHYKNLNIQVEGEEKYYYRYNCQNELVRYRGGGHFRVVENKALSYYFSNHTAMTEYIDSSERSDNGYPKIRTLVNMIDQDATNLTIKYYGKTNHFATSPDNITSHHLKPGKTFLQVGNIRKFLRLNAGGVYTVMVSFDKKSHVDMSYAVLTPPYGLDILWQLPQYFIITMGEIMFSSGCAIFMGGQAPRGMTPIVNIIYWMMAGFGNLLVVAIEVLKLFEDEASKFLFYGALMIADMVLFAFMAYRYKYVERKNNTEANNTETAKEYQSKGVLNLGFIDNEQF